MRAGQTRGMLEIRNSRSWADTRHVADTELEKLGRHAPTRHEARLWGAGGVGTGGEGGAVGFRGGFLASLLARYAR